MIKNEPVLYVFIFLAQLITVMNTTMFNVALPEISEQFNISAKSSSLIVSSYSVVFSFCIVLYSKLSNYTPVKHLLSIGVLLLGLGSLIGMLSSSFFMLIVARVIQALGSSAITALGVIITTRYIPFHRRGKRLGQIASAVTLGFGLGPFIGGVLTQFLGWEYLFAISLIGLIGIPFYILLLPYEKGEREEFDYAGMLILFISIALLIGGITLSWILIPFSVVMFYMYMIHIKRHRSPFMQPNLLKNGLFLRVIGIAFVIYFINFSMLFILPFTLSTTYEIQNAALIGLILFPGAFTASLLSIYIGRAVDRYGPEKVMVFGITGMPLALIVASLFGQTSIFFLVLAFSISSSSFVCITTTLPNILSNGLVKDYVTPGIGTLQLIQFTSGAIGVTLSGKLITQFQLLYPTINEFVLIFGILFIFSLLAFMFNKSYKRIHKESR